MLHNVVSSYAPAIRSHRVEDLPRLISAVIPCYNPRPWLRDAIASLRAQTHPAIEIIVVDDGTDSEEGREVLRACSAKADQIVRQPNRGLAAARNAGFRAAAADYIVPLDSDDLLQPAFIEECLAALDEHPAAAFAYTDYRVFGRANYVERLDDYNLYRLLSENTLIYACTMRKSAWEAAGGYDESMRFGYEDWELWLRFGAKRFFGHHIGRVLFKYRKHGRSLFDLARERHDELVAKIRAHHPELYAPAACAAIKAEWEPAVCIAGPRPSSPQTITDLEEGPPGDTSRLLNLSRASAFLLTPYAGAADSHATEMAALAAWGGYETVELPGGCLAVSRTSLSHYRTTEDIRPMREARDRPRPPGPHSRATGRLGVVLRHLENAGLLSFHAWLKHPLQSATRLIPLRMKERANQLAGRRLFDLSFYLQFQPRAILLSGRPVAPVEYLPHPPTRRRIALVTPHLGAGGAESVLLEIAGACERSAYELSVIATHSNDSRWHARWRQQADHIYDLAALVPPERVPAALYSIAANWAFDFILIQNSLSAYTIAAELRKRLPRMRLMNLIHSADDEGWDLISTTAAASPYFDVQIAISETVRKRLLESGARADRIRLIRNGVELSHFRPLPVRSRNPARILFAGRLDPVKRPLMLADIALALKKYRKPGDFRFVVAGEGPEGDRLRARVAQAGLDQVFEFLGHMEDMAPVFADTDLLAVTSENEGVPLVVLEAMACARPVIASDAGAIHEVVNEHTGVLIDKAANEPERFAEAIHRLLEAPEIRARLGQSARALVERAYNRQASVAAYRELFR